ncbi:hypothetical protein FDG96_gp07 [Bacillus phage Mgbh1]|uniref:Uncharacterized protein n=1 Tax=Bacillus phage Mgbh1 TaxID=1796993 RepID=A0A142F1K9_9CAUD|nr:hypothetical protein FDG96_gp07 [Bacillus phage Mgbh1]AMQ66666.1 hypothetical protein [Bacillus phage Mgbh1]
MKNLTIVLLLAVVATILMACVDQVNETIEEEMTSITCEIEPFEKYGWEKSFESEAVCENIDEPMSVFIDLDRTDREIGDVVTLSLPTRLLDDKNYESLMHAHDLVVID